LRDWNTTSQPPLGSAAQSLWPTVPFERLNDFLAQIPTPDFPVKPAFRAIAAPCMELTD
jgi:hypothetical protein